jgi:hypothetical protein
MKSAASSRKSKRKPTRAKGLGVTDADYARIGRRL